MSDYDYRSRRQLASERADRLAQDYARASASSYRSRARQALSPPAWEPLERARRKDARPQEA
jgi:hypothetical protein